MLNKWIIHLFILKLKALYILLHKCLCACLCMCIGCIQVHTGCACVRGVYRCTQGVHVKVRAQSLPLLFFHFLFKMSLYLAVAYQTGQTGWPGSPRCSCLHPFVLRLYRHAGLFAWVVGMWTQWAPHPQSTLTPKCFNIHLLFARLSSNFLDAFEAWELRACLISTALLIWGHT